MKNRFYQDENNDATIEREIKNSFFFVHTLFIVNFSLICHHETNSDTGFQVYFCKYGYKNVRFFLKKPYFFMKQNKTKNENGQFAIRPGGRCAIDFLYFNNKRAELTPPKSGHINILDFFRWHSVCRREKSLKCELGRFSAMDSESVVIYSGNQCSF